MFIFNPYDIIASTLINLILKGYHIFKKNIIKLFYPLPSGLSLRIVWQRSGMICEGVIVRCGLCGSVTAYMACYVTWQWHGVLRCAIVSVFHKGKTVQYRVSWTLERKSVWRKDVSLLQCVWRRDSVLACCMNAWQCDGMLCEDVSEMECWLKARQYDCMLCEGVTVWWHVMCRCNSEMPCCMEAWQSDNMLNEGVKMSYMKALSVMACYVQAWLCDCMLYEGMTPY